MSKSFDCVEFMHQGARRIFEETRGMTRQEEIAYWRKRSQVLARGHQTRAAQKSGEQQAAHFPR